MRRLFLMIRRKHDADCDCYKCLKKRSDDKFERDFKDVEEVLEHKPNTWHKYHGKPHGYFDTIKMEYDELMACKEAGDHPGIVENLEHVAAACIDAHHAMTCKEY